MGSLVISTPFLFLVLLRAELLQPVPQDLTWKIAGLGEMAAHDGTSLSFKSYRAQDGEAVTLVHGEFRTPERCRAELNIETKQAKTVIFRGPLKDKLGNVVGQRAIILLPTRSESAVSAVLWTDGVSYYAVLSPSLQVALEWEKRYRH